MEFNFEQINVNIHNNILSSLGAGSGRQVYDLGNGYVVKVAKNKRGLAQNKAEYAIASVDHTDFFAKVPQVSENFGYLIMERAEKISKISEVWTYYKVKSNKQLFRLEGLKGISSTYHLMLPDLCRPANWGRIRGRPVIIDYGFTQNVRKKYYSLF